MALHEPLEPVFGDGFVVDRFHTDIPPIRPQELRIIGRMVSFDADTFSAGATAGSGVFRGWVSHITKETVTLLDVVRFADAAALAASSSDPAADARRFPLLLHRLPDAPSAILPRVTETTVAAAPQADAAVTASDGDEPRAFGHENEMTPTRARRNPSPPTSSNAAAAQTSDHVEDVVASEVTPCGAVPPPGATSVPSPSSHPPAPDVECCIAQHSSVPSSGTFGVIPYATFHRKKIRNVKFETDGPVRAAGRPADAFLNSDVDPIWYPHDLQKLRMFIRRYLIHTSQGNNTQQLSLLDFLNNRMGWAAHEHVALLQQTVQEELEDLRRIDEEITARVELQQRQQQEREAARANGGAGSRPAQQSSALVVTGIPSRTSYVAIVMFAAGVGVLLYSASVFTTTEKLLVMDFVRSTVTYAVVAGASLLVSGAMTAYHAFRMTLPLQRKPVALRLFFTTIASILVAYALYLISGTYFQFEEADGTSLLAFFSSKVKTDAGMVCSYFLKYSCSGFSQSCSQAGGDLCPTCTRYPAGGCEASLQDKVKSTQVALFVMLIAAAVALLVDYYLMLKLRRIARLARSAA